MVETMVSSSLARLAQHARQTVSNRLESCAARAVIARQIGVIEIVSRGSRSVRGKSG